MAEFFVEKSANENGEYLLHSSKCTSMPANENMRYLGAYATPSTPLNEATFWYNNVTTCPHCIASSSEAAAVSKAA